MTEARRLSGLTYVVTKEPARLCDTAYSFLECGRSIRAATVESKVSLASLVVEKDGKLTLRSTTCCIRSMPLVVRDYVALPGNIRAHVENNQQFQAEIAEFSTSLCSGRMVA